MTMVKEPLHGSSSYMVFEVRDSIPVISSTDGREQKMRLLHKAKSIILFDVEQIFLEGF